MAKGRYVPRANVLLTDLNKLVKANLEELQKVYEKWIDLKVEGPYVVSLEGYKPGESFERIEPNGSYFYGLPHVYVGIGVKQTVEDQHFKPFVEKNPKIEETLAKLEEVLKIEIITSVDSLDELEVKVTTLSEIATEKS